MPSSPGLPATAESEDLPNRRSSPLIVAFFLPACHDTDTSSLVHATHLMGWQCAWLSITMIFDSAALSLRSFSLSWAGVSIRSS